MSQTAINNNSRLRPLLPRQLDGARNPFPKPGFFFIPFEPSEEELQAAKARKEEGESNSIVVFFLLILLVAAGIYIYWTRVPIPQIGSITLAAQNVSNVPSVMEIRYVNVYELNMRETPSEYSPVKFILPRDTRTEVLNEAQQEFDGDVWVKVRVQTGEGPQDGWVSARYLR